MLHTRSEIRAHSRMLENLPSLCCCPRMPSSLFNLPMLHVCVCVFFNCTRHTSAQVWGLDFGDCHRSLFAHQDTITSVRFVRDTHYAFR